MLHHVKPVVGVIAGEKIDLAEDLERVDDGQDRHEQHRRGQVPELDVEELVRRRRALDLRDLKQLARDIAERGHEQDHVVSEVFPQKQHNNDDHAVIRFQPVDLVRAEHGQKFVHDAVIVEQHLPDEDDGRDGHHHGAEEKRAELALERNARLEHQRQSQRQHDRQRHGKAGERERVFDRDLERAVLPDVDIVFETRKAVVGQTRGEGIVDDDQKRDNIKRQHAEKARPGEAHGREKIAHLVVHPRPEPFLGRSCFIFPARPER